uniref:Uncharacterized protein n=1 Tax=Rhizophora mucronata TaxID=61149 RepID=A0A2P2PI27_RHIMU
MLYLGIAQLSVVQFGSGFSFKPPVPIPMLSGNLTKL